MYKYKVGDMVTVPLGGAPLFGVVIFIDEKTQKYLVRINGTQQLYYNESELAPYESKNS